MFDIFSFKRDKGRKSMEASNKLQQKLAIIQRNTGFFLLTI